MRSPIISAIGLGLLLALLPWSQAQQQAATTDPLPSWNEGPVKKAILDYVARVTDKAGPDFIPPEDRIATFDNDGTLWCEKPTVEVAFTRDRLAALAAKDPTLKERQPFKAALEGDMDFFHINGPKVLMELISATHGNMAQKHFDAEAREFFKTAKHPKFQQPYPKMGYQPMIEVLHLMRAHGFQTWICSGGFMDFMRPITQEAYGIPPQQVIGSSLKKEMVEKDGEYLLWILSQFFTICDHEGKPVDIAMHIGKRPVFSAGNVRTGGDIEMLRYCQASPYKTLQLMVNHDDAEREYAYAEKGRESLNAAEKYRWHVVSMKNDWKRIFGFER